MHGEGLRPWITRRQTGHTQLSKIEANKGRLRGAIDEGRYGRNLVGSHRFARSVQQPLAG
jgi:hypothetical protein